MEELVAYFTENLTFTDFWGDLSVLAPFIALLVVFSLGLYTLGKFLYFKYYF